MVKLKIFIAAFLAKIKFFKQLLVITDIHKDLFQKFVFKFEEEKLQVEKEIKNCSLSSSNLKSYVANCVSLISNLNKIWELGDYSTKQRLQKLLFPEGISYNKEKDKIQTDKVNPILQLTSFLSTSYNKEKSEQIVEFTNLSALVTSAGFKPATS